MERNSDEYRRAEFSGLRAEIDRRSSEQFQLLSLSLTIFGVLAGTSLVDPAPDWARRLLVLVPFLSSVLGLLWLDHDRTITAIGRYIDEELWPTGEPSFERLKARYRPRRSSLLLGFAAPVVSAFLGPAAYALIAAPKDVDRWLRWLGATAVAVYCLAALVGIAARHAHSDSAATVS